MCWTCDGVSQEAGHHNNNNNKKYKEIERKKQIYFYSTIKNDRFTMKKTKN